ncbi:putative hydro-lyase [Alkalibacillus almallahensis]|uniref:putative hydro-lyase n=1 Tax=Alkalibacillus almallahensis TaxID=1379154 RepID=UPI0014242A0F|nr:putative hydro-lyase [Alkalibacillus almallahensis]NIK11488.1 uncharacterized protein YcsI (UPF0317 family) [Alkalibacillus almallahensis]
MRNPKEMRDLFRKNERVMTTSDLCPHYLQTNLISLPYEYAFDFLLFCKRNPKACPLIEVLEPGQVEPVTAPGADIRSDVPKYRIYENGHFSKEVLNLHDDWDKSFVTFLIGCSFTFEKALVEQGIQLLHQEQQRVIPMYRTTIPCQSAGRFAGNLVVSMRPLKPSEVDQAVDITSKFETSHGSPVHIGDPAEIGIEDINHPDYGESVDFEDDRVPVFWACGVTPQNVLEKTGISIFVSHAPGHMFITDSVEQYR